MGLTSYHLFYASKNHSYMTNVIFNGEGIREQLLPGWSEKLSGEESYLTGFMFSLVQSSIPSRYAPGRNISLIPASLSAEISSSGMMPPPITVISPALFSFSC